MYGKKELTTLNEDFKQIGLIKDKDVTSSAPNKIQESKPATPAVKVENKAPVQTKTVAQPTKAATTPKVESKKEPTLEELMTAKAKIESAINKKKAQIKEAKDLKAKQANLSPELQNLVNLESKINNFKKAPDMAKIQKAFEQAANVANLGSNKVKKLAEEGEEIGTVPAEYKDMTGPNPKEGNPENPMDGIETAEVDGSDIETATGIEAGVDTYPNSSPEEVKIVENELPADDKDDLALEMDDENPEDPNAPKAEDDMPVDDQISMEADLDPASELSVEDEPMDMGSDADLDISLDDMDDACSCDDNLDVDMVDAPAPAPMESKNLKGKAKYEALQNEFKAIKKESEDILAKIKGNAISPAEADKVMKDVVTRLNGTVADLTAMEKFAGTDKVTQA